MAYLFNPFSGTFDITSPDNYSFSTIAASRIIPTYQQMIVSGDITIVDAELTLDGDVVVIDFSPFKPIETLVVSDTLSGAHYTVLCDSSANAITVTLPASPDKGRIYNIKNIDDTNGVTVSGNGKNIDGSSSYILADKASMSIHYDGTEWWIL